MTHLLVNKWKCKDGTILNSRHRHDYVSYTDSNGNWSFLDGGLEGYIRHSGNLEPLCVYSTDPHEKIRDNFEWTSYGRNGDEELHYILLKNLTDEHIASIIRTQTHLSEHITKVFTDEVKFREEQLKLLVRSV